MVFSVGSNLGNTQRLLLSHKEIAGKGKDVLPGTRWEHADSLVTIVYDATDKIRSQRCIKVDIKFVL